MSKHAFKYYLHDTDDHESRVESIQNQMPEGVVVDPETLGRPFYEVTLECEYDTETGAVTITSAASTQ